MRGFTWGQQVVDFDEQANSWAVWQTAPGVSAVVQNDSDWGQLQVAQGVATYSSVEDIGDGYNKRFSVTTPKYGSNSGSVTISIRGSDTAFGQHDALPVWEPYTGTIDRQWRYIQLKLEYAP